MVYNLVITEKAAQQEDESISYIINILKNPQAALHLLDELEAIYSRLCENPFQFPPCDDPQLSQRGYHKAALLNMDYVIIFKVIDKSAYVMGFFHQKENYSFKI